MLDSSKRVVSTQDAGLPDGIPGVGFTESMVLQDGIGAAVQRLRLSQDFVSAFEGADLLKFHVRLSGRRILVFQGRHTVDLDGPGTAVLMHDDGVHKLERVAANRDEFCVTTMIPRERFWEYLDEEQTGVPSALHSLIVRKRSQPRMAVAASTRQEQEVASAVINCRRTGAIRRLFIEAKTTELFCLIVDRLRTVADAPAPKMRVTERDRRQLASVRDLLSVEFANPPTIHVLSRRFGLNRNKLCGGFLQSYGVTVYEFCDSLRMENARRLLAESQLAISEIADSLGYGSSSAFSAAFHRRFGHSPSQARQARIGHSIVVPD
jgi:AraC-like DNA-binding protein